MTATEIAELLSRQAEAVAKHLIPGGKRNGAQWIAGSVQGEAGNSLKVQTAGTKAGWWADWSTDQKGDLIGLWQEVRGCDLRTACAQALDFLGVDDKTPSLQRPMKSEPKKYVRPKEEGIEPLQSGGQVFDYLTKKRGLDFKVLDRYGVRQFNHASHGPSIVFPIKNPAGETVCLKYLALTRHPETGKKTVWASAESQPRLFGWQGIDPQTREVFLTEGEVDALTVAGWGCNALSVPFGVEGTQWIEHDWDDLARFDRINLCMDMDDAGNRAAESLALRLGRERCWRVKLPHKDANECLSKGMNPTTFQECVNISKGYDPAALKGAETFIEEVITNELSTVANPTGTPCPWMIPWRVRDGELTVVTGFSGSGKSLVISQILAHDLKAEKSCCIASLEIKPRKTLWILARQLMGRTPRHEADLRPTFAWMGGKVWVVASQGSTAPDLVFEAFIYAARRYGVKRFVIDSLACCGFAEDDYNGQKAFAARYADFCQTYDVHGFLVAHSRKKEDEDKAPSKFDVRGGAALTDLAWNGFSIWRNKKKNESLIAAATDGERNRINELPDAGITFWKQRETGDEPSIPLWLHGDSGQFHEKPGQYGVVYLPTP